MSYGRTSVLILVLLFLSVLLLTNPLGDFPLNDDWSYGQAVRNLIQNHEYQLTNWTSMPLLTQVLWGAFFSLPDGFSFTALRFSTLLLSLAGLMLLLLLVRPRGERMFPALLAPLLLLFNPVYLNLSHTFMTDVPFIAFMLGSILFLVRGTERQNKLLLALGVFLGVLATLLRQTGMLIPVAFSLGYLSRGRVTVRRVLLPAGFLLLTVGSFVAYTRWLSATGRLPTGYFAQTQQVVAVLGSGLPALARRAVGSLLTTFIYLGLFTLPIGLLFLDLTRKRRLAVLLGVSAALLALAQLLHVGFAGNILSDRGVGPFTLAHSDSYPAFTGAKASTAVLGLLVILGGALLLEMLARVLRNVRSAYVCSVCLSLAGLYSTSLLLVQQFDRYMLVYLPLLAIPAMVELRRAPPARTAVAATLAALLLYGVFSVCAVHDYLAWNRTRWQAIGQLTSGLGVGPERIDGGFEFNGLHTYSEDYVRSPNKSPWWVKDDEYVVAFDIIPGYEVFRSFPVKSWLPAGIKRIYTLRRARHSDDSAINH